MGEVYRARDTRLSRTVAVKVLPSPLAQSAESRERFEREARLIASLNHPHICTLYNVGREGENEYLVMEHLEGETLSSRLQRGPLSLEQTLEYSMQIADALDKAHRKGVTHRDLKPGNIMLTASGAKLLDFGLAKWQQPTLHAGQCHFAAWHAGRTDHRAGHDSGNGAVHGAGATRGQRGRCPRGYFCLRCGPGTKWPREGGHSLARARRA